MRRLYVNTYERDRNWGGPEEGGWWFDSGTPVASKKVKGKKMAEQWWAHITARLPEPEIPVYSVMYTGGDLVAFIEEHPAKAWPDRTPYYE